MIDGYEGQYAAARACNGAYSLGAELADAAAGSQEAWDAIVDRFAPAVWSIARRRHLSRPRAAEVCDLTWMRLLDHLPSMRAEDLAGWLETTAERECVRVDRLHPSERGGPLSAV
jgi:DNA-directed RNA polymerase specialized sigma24 family protein